MKKIILLLCILFTGICYQSIAQTTAYCGYPAVNYFSKVVTTTDNGYLAIGRFGQLGIVVKFNSTLDVLWAKSIKGGVFTIPIACIETKNGNYIIETSYTKNNKSAINIIKLSPTGSILSQNCIYSNQGDLVAYKSLTKSLNDDGFLCGGGNCIGSNFIIKCDGSSNVVWSKQFIKSNTSGAVQTVTDIITENDKYTFCSYASNANTSNDIYMMQIDDNGALLDARGFIGQGQQSPQQILKLPNGKYVIGAHIGTSNQDNYFCFVDATLNAVSTKKYVVANDNLFSMIGSSANNLIIAGSNYITTSSAKRNLYMSVDDNGAVAWAKQSDGQASPNFYDEIWSTTKGIIPNTIIGMGTSFGDKGTAVSMDFNGNGFCKEDIATVVTTTPFSLIVQTPTINITPLAVLTDTSSYLLVDEVVTKVLHCGSFVSNPESILSINNKYFNLQSIPNPCTSQIQIDGLPSTIHKVILYDAMGKKHTAIFRATSAGTITINTDNLISGIYYTLLFNKNDVYKTSFQKR